MTDTLTIAIAQTNPTVGDVEGNLAQLRDAWREAKEGGADLVVSGELAVAGYPPEDLVLKGSFQDMVEAGVEELAKEIKDGPGLLIGSPWRGKAETGDGALFNAALLLDGGRVADVRAKHLLPNYGVFDEKRLFAPGPLPGPINFRGIRLGVMVCEDMWEEDVSECLEESGAQALIVLNGSPFEARKPDLRLNHAVARVTECGLALMYVNLVGGQDELVFDGASFVLGPDCSLTAKARSWTPDLMLTRWRLENDRLVPEAAEIARAPEGHAAIYNALVLGLRDYVTKNGFPGVVLGLSGGVDSALSAAVAVDALGPGKVEAVMMPSRFTSEESLADAAETARLLGIAIEEIPIEPAVDAFTSMLGPRFNGRAPDVTEENIQARIRGLTLMAISNKFGHMLLTTGNKSEMSVGYATLYGDMCGGYSVLKDVYKTAVFQLCHWRNQNTEAGFLGPKGRVMPENVITKPPTAELRENQKDQDSLPPYEELDAILEGLIEEERSVRDLVAHGFDADTVGRVWRLLDRAEYKRRQAPPGVKITARAFGRDRRYPITNGFTRLAHKDVAPS